MQVLCPNRVCRRFGANAEPTIQIMFHALCSLEYIIRQSGHIWLELGQKKSAFLFEMHVNQYLDICY
jgi:hypothetical protein